MSGKAAIYLCDTADGTPTETQRGILENIAVDKGWKIENIYEEEGSILIENMENRPIFRQLKTDIDKNIFDAVISWSIDQLGISLRGLLDFLNDLQRHNTELYVHQQQIDTTTIEGEDFLRASNIFFQFENAVHKLRVQKGVALSKKDGKIHGRPKIKIEREIAIRDDLLSGAAGIRKIATKHGVGVSVVQRIKTELSKQSS